MNEVAQAAQAAQTAQPAQPAQPEFPDVFIEYAREKLKTDRNLVEYLIEFGRPISKRRAQMILDAAGVGDKNGK